jgi:hypothetical protein
VASFDSEMDPDPRYVRDVIQMALQSARVFSRSGKAICGAGIQKDWTPHPKTRVHVIVEPDSASPLQRGF